MNEAITVTGVLVNTLFVMSAGFGLAVIVWLVIYAMKQIIGMISRNI